MARVRRRFRLGIFRAFNRVNLLANLRTQWHSRGLLYDMFRAADRALGDKRPGNVLIRRDYNLADDNLENYRTLIGNEKCQYFAWSPRRVLMIPPYENLLPRRTFAEEATDEESRYWESYSSKFWG